MRFDNSLFLYRRKKTLNNRFRIVVSLLFFGTFGESLGLLKMKFEINV